MAAEQHVLAVVIGDRAHGADAHVAGDQNAAHGVAGLQGMLPAGHGLGMVMVLPAPPPATVMPICWKIGREFAQNVFVETGEVQRRLDGNHAGVWKEDAPDAPAETTCASIPRRNLHRFARRDFVGRARVGGTRFVEIVYFEHQLDGSDAAKGVRRKHAEAQRDRAHQLAVDVNRAAAHSARHVGAMALPPILARIMSCLGPH